MFAHGNAELIDYWPEEFDEPRRWGAGVLLVEYPGYGRSDGAPSQDSITESMLAAYDWARQHADVDASRIIPYGRSLGGGAAAIARTRRVPVPAVDPRIVFLERRGIRRGIWRAGVSCSRPVRQRVGDQIVQGTEPDPARRPRRHRAAASRPRAGCGREQRHADIHAVRPQRLSAPMGRCSCLSGPARPVDSAALIAARRRIIGPWTTNS